MLAIQRVQRLLKSLSLTDITRADTFGVAMATLSTFCRSLLSDPPVYVGFSGFSSYFSLLSVLLVQVGSSRFFSIVLFISELPSIPLA